MGQDLKLGADLIIVGFLAVFLAFPIRPIGNILGLVGVFVAMVDSCYLLSGAFWRR